MAMDATFFPDFYLDIEVEDMVGDLNRSQYSVSLYVNDKKAEKSKKSKPQSSAVKWEWKTNSPM
jgi:phage host-nuclease inhibitor protein Gam